MSKDVAALIGAWAEGVESRSLLFEKFTLPKVWGVKNGGKLNDAGRWNVLRIVTRGPEVLRDDAQRLRREASGQNVQPGVSERKEREAHVAEKMANTSKVDAAIARVGTENGVHFLGAVAKSFPGRVITFEATLSSRMVINLAGGVVENAGIALDRCFGLPLIPGSALKGICRSQALWEISAASGEEKARLLRCGMQLFGYSSQDIKPNGDFFWAGGPETCKSLSGEIPGEDFKGCACFLPAYPTTTPMLVVDMVNPHYPEYYRGRSGRAEDNESPVPNYFPAVEAGSCFGFAVLLNRSAEVPGNSNDALLKQAREWLERAITRKGVGAKTAAGYGWFEFGRKRPGAPFSTPPEQKSPAVAASPADQIIGRFRTLATKDNFPAALPLLAALPDADLRRSFEALVPAHERARLRKNNPYWQAFTSGRAGAEGQKILARLGLKLT